MVSFLIDPRYTWYTPMTFAAVSSNTVVNNNNNNGVTTNNTTTNTTNNTTNNTNTNNNGNTGDVVAPKSDDYQAQFNTKLGLIQKYCSDYIVLDENGNEIDVNKIRAEYAGKLEEGVKYCDELIKSFDQDKVNKMVKAQYTQRVNQNAEAGKTIADEWVKAIDEAGTTAATINTSNVNANNVLDVIGGFLTNDKVKNGNVALTQLFENPTTAEALVAAIKTKAQSFIKREDLDATTKETIVTQTNELADAKNTYSSSSTEDMVANRTALVNKYMTLFETLRTKQAELNDAAAPKYYGLPSDTTVTFTNETDKANEEVQAYKNRKRLNTNI